MHVHFAIPGDLEARTGGYGYDRRLIAALRDRGVTVEVLALPAGFPAPSTEDLAQTDRVFGAIAGDSLVLVDGLAFGAMPEVARRHRERLRLVALCHHPLGLETGLDAETAAHLIASEHAALDCAREVIVTSMATARTLATQFAVPESILSVALPGTDRRPPAACIGDPPVLLTVATLIPRKGHDVLIEALDQLHDRRWTARFVGGDHFDPAWTARLKADVAERGLSDRIAFTGPVLDAHAEMDAADVFVLPSRYEGYGMAFAEALAHGLPVIAARTGAVADVVPPEAGFLVPPDDPGALTEAIAAVLDDDGVRARARAGARAAADHLPTWDDTAAAVIRALQRLEK